VVGFARPPQSAYPTALELLKGVLEATIDDAGNDGVERHHDDE
jgi:hypothetical protein